MRRWKQTNRLIEYMHQYGRIESLKETVIHINRYLDILKDELNYIERILKVSKNIDTLQLFNEIFSKYKIVFDLVADNSNNQSAFIKGTTQRANITIFVNENFYKYTSINYLDVFNGFKKECLLLFGHELVHRGQYYVRTGDKINFYNFDGENEPNENYLSNPQEMMAYAWMYIESLHYAGFKDDEIFNMVKTGNLRKVWSLHIDFYLSDMKILNLKVYKRFLRYIYQYLENPIIYNLKVVI